MSKIDQPSGFGDGIFEATATTEAKRKPWVANKPEQRLSIAWDRFVRRALERPFYASAIQDSDGGARSMQQRVRDDNRGIKKGQLDWDMVQGPGGLARKLELKRGDNGTTPAQKQTIADLTACGAPPIVAWTLREAFNNCVAAGFRFTAGAETVLQHCEALLEGWDREAEAIKSGLVVRPKSKQRKAGPRFTWKARA